MNENLLVTKLHIPVQQPNRVSRPRLFQLLGEGLSHALTLISAPAGFGKTSLVSDWLNSSDMDAAWVSLDQDDNDGTRFLGYLYAAIQAAHPNFDAEGMPKPEELIPSEVKPVATQLINGVESLVEVVVLVLDNFQEIRNPSIHSFVAYLVSHISRNLHLFLVTRMDPPLPLARWRGRGMLLEIRSDSLRFTQDEVETYLDQSLPELLTSAEARTVHLKTEGWVTGLKLMALSLRHQEDYRGFIQSISGRHEYIADYLVDEVLDHQPQEILTFLLKTSILEHLNSDLCSAITGIDQTQLLLERLERENLFLEPLDLTRQWFRYHTLFRELLLRRLNTTHSAEVSVLFSLASSWHAQNGNIGEAIRYAWRGGDITRQIELTKQYILDLFLQGEFYQAQNWVEWLPPGVSEADPVLCIAQAWIEIRTLSLEQAQKHHDQAEELCKNLPNREAIVVRSHAATLKAVLARTTHQPPEEQLNLIRAALDLIPESSPGLRSMMEFRKGLCYMDLGEDQKAGQVFKRIIAEPPSNQNHYTRFGAAYVLTVLTQLDGRLHDVKAVCDQMLDELPPETKLPWPNTSVQGFAHIALGLVEVEWNHLQDAYDRLERGLRMNAASRGLLELQVKGEYALGRLQVALGQHPTRMDLSRLEGGQLPQLKKFAHALQAHLWLMDGQLSTPPALNDSLIRWAGHQSLSFTEGVDQDWQVKHLLVYIRVILVLRHLKFNIKAFPSCEDILDFLDGLVQTCAKRGWNDRVIECQVIKALALDSSGARPAALDCLQSALAMAEPGGYRRIFLDEGAPMAALLYALLEQARPPSSAYLHMVLKSFKLEAERPHLAVGSSSFQLTPLTQRELEVLRLIADGYSNHEICQELTISLGTVKRHTANINLKLDVHSRTQAVAAARRFGLLP